MSFFITLYTIYLITLFTVRCGEVTSLNLPGLVLKSYPKPFWRVSDRHFWILSKTLLEPLVVKNGLPDTFLQHQGYSDLHAHLYYYTTQMQCCVSYLESMAKNLSCPYQNEIGIFFSKIGPGVPKWLQNCSKMDEIVIFSKLIDLGYQFLFLPPHFHTCWVHL